MGHFNPSLRVIYDHVADLEKALCKEVDSRISSEDRIREQVDAKVNVAIERLADATETELARMYRRIEADIMNKLDGISRDMTSLQSSVGKLNRQIELVTVETRDNRDRLGKLEKQLGGSLGDSSSSGVSENNVTEGSRREMSRLKEMIESDLGNARKLDDLDAYVTGKVMTRIETIEDWLKSSLTPEVLRLKEQIKAESILREDNDRELMDVVSQYTEIMRRHYGTISESKPSLSADKNTIISVESKIVNEDNFSEESEPATSLKKSPGWMQLNNVFST
jgi:hypothetical protein